MRVGFITNLSEEDFKFAAENDIPCVEHISFGNVNVVQESDHIKRMTKKYGVDFSMLALFSKNYITDDAAEAKRHLADAKTMIDLCADIGAPVMVTCAGEAEDRDFETNCARAVELFSTLVEYGKPKGIKIALYNCHITNFAYAPEAWEVILKQVPEMGLKFDPSHTFYDGRDYLKEARDWGHRFYHLHGKGVLMIDGQPFEDPPPGMDMINWGALMAVLYHHNYDADINIEPHARTWTGERRYAGILIAKRHLEQFIF